MSFAPRFTVPHSEPHNLRQARDTTCDKLATGLES